MNEPKYLTAIAEALEDNYLRYVAIGWMVPEFLAHIRELRAALATALTHPGTLRFDVDAGEDVPCDCDECKAARQLLERQGPPEVKP